MIQRDLNFDSLDDILTEVQALSAGRCSAEGNWTPAENVDHVAKSIGFTVHGFPEGKAPVLQKLLFTTVFKLMSRKLLSMKLKPGLKFPGGLQYFAPEPGVAWDEAVRRLEQNIADAKTHKMTHPSPVAGRLTHEQWTLLHCRHAELHLGLIHPSDV
ncbi:MAG: DUF1569 domain-containing protein [Phycisphaerales bacterium JB063]